jgi:hypothetical protein
MSRGYGLVVEHVLAKDETGVRFSLPAQRRSEATEFVRVERLNFFSRVENRKTFHYSSETN